MSQHYRHPPEWMVSLLRLFCPPQLFEEIEGDLIERYQKHARARSINWARRKFFWSVILFFRPGILFRNTFSLNLLSMHMVLNYLKTAWRVMGRSKSFTVINISGLSVGITGALLLFMWIAHEFSFDHFHSNKDQLYIAWNRAVENGQIHCWSTTPRVLAPTLQKEFASVERSASFAQWGTMHLFKVGDKRIQKSSGVFTDEAFLTMFSFPLLAGEPGRALSSPNSIVITEDLARQLFDDRNGFGETVTLAQGDYEFEFTVSGVMKSLPANTSFQFEYLIPFKFLESIGEKDEYWGNNSVTTLVQLTKGSSPDDVNREIRDVEKKHYAAGQHIEIFLHPLTANRLYSRFENGVSAGGRIEIMRMLIILGICLVLIASINFVNLSTARAQHRCKEVAIRKVNGAMRLSLIMQFLLESILLTFISGIVAIAFAYLLLPFFNNLVDQNIPFLLTELTFTLPLGVALLVLGLLAGSYPALYLSGFSPRKIFRTASLAPSKSNFRSALVVAQFGFAIVLVVSVFVIYKQINFVKSRDTGYSRDQLVFVPLTGELPKNYRAFRNELIGQNVAVSMTKTSGPLTMQWSSTTGIGWRGKNPEERTDIERIWVDDQVASTVGVKLLQGRDFDLQNFPTDSSAVIINESVLRLMGFTNPVGETISDNGKDWKVIGVVKDFVFTSPFGTIEPVIFFGARDSWAFNYAYIKINAARPMNEQIASVASAFKKYNPDYPFEIHFADLDYQAKFDNMRGTLQLTILFAGLAIFIACLGLLGLALYMTETRQKEVGIRKVLGGSVMSIAKLLTYASLKPILIAIVVFSPMAWFAMKWWLESFTYRTTLDFWVIPAAAACVLAIAIITIISQTIAAARKDPVQTLKAE